MRPTDKLRTLFDDQLLVRSGNAMVPTPRGLELLETARAALHEIVRPLVGSTLTPVVVFIPLAFLFTFISIQFNVSP